MIFRHIRIITGSFWISGEEYGYMIVAEFGDSTENGVLTNAVGASVKANKFYSTFREIAQGFLNVW